MGRAFSFSSDNLFETALSYLENSPVPLFYLSYVSFCNNRIKLRSLARTRRCDREESMGHDNLAYRQPRSLPNDELEMEVMVSPQFDAGFSKPRFYPGGHCQTQDNENGRSDNFHSDPSDPKGATGTRSEV